MHPIGVMPYILPCGVINISCSVGYIRHVAVKELITLRLAHDRRCACHSSEWLNSP